MGIEQDRIIAGTGGRDDEVADRAVRPKSLADYVGQPNVKNQSSSRRRVSAARHSITC
jgi:Holliday junction resolvasome RuvABC ATP-dependent DNA helicase subunit